MHVICAISAYCTRSRRRAIRCCEIVPPRNIDGARVRFATRYPVQRALPMLRAFALVITHVARLDTGRIAIFVDTALTIYADYTSRTDIDNRKHNSRRASTSSESGVMTEHAYINEVMFIKSLFSVHFAFPFMQHRHHHQNSGLRRFQMFLLSRQ